MGPSYPIFTCPNCRAAADLDADIEEPDEDWQLDSGAEDDNMEESKGVEPQPVHAGDSSQNLPDGAADSAVSQTSSREGDAGDATIMLDRVTTAQEPAPEPTPASPMPIPRASTPGSGQARGVRTPSPNGVPVVNVHEGPLTPRNDAGPWVFDGDAGRSSQDVSRPGAMVNLDAAAATNAS
ncbi:hypothetical protein JX266_012031 [Neoarthrinium moseri]|nr:hypothetical protein JX266_012031 [Neoarthrinium moseri]